LAAATASDETSRRAIFDTIERDITRTFTQSAFFSTPGDAASGHRGGQGKLFRVLVAYAHYDRVVGYCQGMAFVAALLISYLGGDEEDCFWLLVALMRSPRHGLSGLYAPGLPLAERHNHCLQGLLNTLRPALGAKLLQLELHPTMYANAWFMTLFSYSCPLPLVVRVFDSFLWEGYKVIFRVALQLLIAFEAPLLASSGLEEVMAVFKLMPEALAGPNGSHHLPNAAVRSERAAIVRNGGAGVARVLALMPKFAGSHEEIDAFLAAAFALPFLHRDLALLDREFDALVAAGCATSAATAGSVLSRGGARSLPLRARELYTAAARAHPHEASATGGGSSGLSALLFGAPAPQAPVPTLSAARPLSWGRHVRSGSS
jgi:hypothetical protein